MAVSNEHPSARLRRVLKELNERGEVPSDIPKAEKALFESVKALRTLNGIGDGGLNFKAFSALEGSSDDWARDVIALMRSEVPIHPLVRERIAEAIEGETYKGTHLELTGGGAGRDFMLGIESRRRWAKIGRWIEAQIAADPNKRGARKRALTAASDHFASSPEKCETALTYTRKMERTIVAPPYDKLSRGWAEDGFHFAELEAARKEKGRSKRGNASPKR